MTLQNNNTNESHFHFMDPFRIPNVLVEISKGSCRNPMRCIPIRLMKRKLVLASNWKHRNEDHEEESRLLKMLQRSSFCSKQLNHGILHWKFETISFEFVYWKFRERISCKIHVLHLEFLEILSTQCQRRRLLDFEVLDQ